MKLSNNIKHLDLTAKSSLDGSVLLHGMKDNTGEGATEGVDATYTLDQIYKNLQSDKCWAVNSTIMQLSQQVQDDYQELRRLIVLNDLFNPGQFGEITKVNKNYWILNK